eukprot:TRINITY_DN30435_c0_g1_i1.p1 TRINITY_DN30435_c0_g1~~TRINITY_DN30435_c0_g1_i1.p1  ORF type:complete len:305 (+),score=62.55 TRINITY_DN30435_c0_g1_i1:184-1098(+)
MAGDRCDVVQGGRGGHLTCQEQAIPKRRPIVATEASAGSSDIAMLSERAPLVRMLCSIHEDLRAYLLLFGEVTCVGGCASACRHLLGSLWTNAGFWRAYGGPCLEAYPLDCPSSELREAFRIWLFHFDGAWTSDFQRMVDDERSSEFGGNYLQLLNDARFVASGLMPSEDVQAVRDFTVILRSLLAGYSSGQLDERAAAEALVFQVERRPDVFTEDQFAAIAAAFAESLERVAADRLFEDEQDQLFDDLHDGSGSDAEHLDVDARGFSTGGSLVAAADGADEDGFSDGMFMRHDVDTVQSFWRA